MSRSVPGMAAILVVSVFATIELTRVGTAEIGTTDRAAAGPVVLAQSSGRRGNLQFDDRLGVQGLNNGLNDDGTTLFNGRSFGTFSSNRLGRMNGQGLGTWTGSGLGVMRDGGLGVPSGRGLGGLSAPGSSLSGNPVQPRNAPQR